MIEGKAHGGRLRGLLPGGGRRGNDFLARLGGIVPKNGNAPPLQAGITVVGATDADEPELMRLARLNHSENGTWSFDEDAVRQAFQDALGKKRGVIGVIRGNGPHTSGRSDKFRISRAGILCGGRIATSVSNAIFISPRGRLL